MDLAPQIDLLLGDFSHLNSRVRHLEYANDVCGDFINVRCSYIAFRDGYPTFDDFIDAIYLHITSFCLPRGEISRALNQIAKADMAGAARVMTQLTEKARSLFIKAKKGSHRSGEAGEIVLYLLVEWILKAPQIVSKMYLKTNNQMPVHGTDGIHARFNSDTKKLHLYWGESKAHVTMASALSSALDSIAEFIANAHDRREIEIVGTFADFHGMAPDAVEAVLKYLDPYAEESNERVVTHACLLVFDYVGPPSKNPEEAEGKFVQTVNQMAEDFVCKIKEIISSKGLDPHRFEFFLMPVPSVQEFRDKFQAKIGWPL